MSAVQAGQGAEAVGLRRRFALERFETVSAYPGMVLVRLSATTSASASAGRTAPKLHVQRQGDELVLTALEDRGAWEEASDGLLRWRAAFALPERFDGGEAPTFTLVDDDAALHPLPTPTRRALRIPPAAEGAVGPPGPSTASDGRARVFVWATFVTLALSSAYFVLAEGRNVPIQEDWRVIAAATGNEEHFWAWVWEPNNEHRVPVQKLLYVLLFQLWPDFHVGMVFNLAALSGTSAAFVVFLRRLRGHTRWTDAFFPIAFLHLGNWENLGWSWQLTFVVAAVLASAILMLVAQRGAWTIRRTALLTVCLVAVPFTGATALPFAAAVAGGLVLQARRLAGPARSVMLIGAAVTIALSAAYFIDLPRSTWVPPSPGLATDLLTGGKFLALGLGPAAGGWWFGAVVVSLLALCSALLLLWQARSRGTWPLLAYVTAGALLALELGRGRAGAVPFFGLPDRYVLVALPLFCAIYVVWERYGGVRVRRVGPAALCATMVLLVPLNSVYGADWKEWYQERVDTLADDVEAGIPLLQLETYRPLALDRTEMRLAMQYMKELDIGPFGALQLRAAPIGGWRIDGLEEGGQGWETINGPASIARLRGRDGAKELEWRYDVTPRVASILGRTFPQPVDWRGAGAMAVTLAGQGTGRRIRVRVSVGGDGGRRPELYDTWFPDTTAATRTIVVPWNAFGRARLDGDFVQPGRKGMPLDRVRSVVFLVTDPGRGRLLLKGVALTPGHAQFGWPLHSAAERRSLPPWR